MYFCNRCGKKDLEVYHIFSETLPITAYRKKKVKLTRVFCTECGEGLVSYVTKHENYNGATQKIE